MGAEPNFDFFSLEVGFGGCTFDEVTLDDEEGGFGPNLTPEELGLAVDLGLGLDLDADLDFLDGRIVDDLVVEEVGARWEDGPVDVLVVAAGVEGWSEDSPAKICSISNNSRVRAAFTPA